MDWTAEQLADLRAFGEGLQEAAAAVGLPIEWLWAGAFLIALVPWAAFCWGLLHKPWGGALAIGAVVGVVLGDVAVGVLLGSFLLVLVLVWSMPAQEHCHECSELRRARNAQQSKKMASVMKKAWGWTWTKLRPQTATP